MDHFDPLSRDLHMTYPSFMPTLAITMYIVLVLPLSPPAVTSNSTPFPASSEPVQRQLHSRGGLRGFHFHKDNTEIILLLLRATYIVQPLI